MYDWIGRLMVERGTYPAALIRSTYVLQVFSLAFVALGIFGIYAALFLSDRPRLVWAAVNAGSTAVNLYLAVLQHRHRQRLTRRDEIFRLADLAMRHGEISALRRDEIIRYADNWLERQDSNLRPPG